MNYNFTSLEQQRAELESLLLANKIAIEKMHTENDVNVYYTPVGLGMTPICSNTIGRTLSHVDVQTPEICLAAVRQNGYASQYVKKQTPKICVCGGLVSKTD